MKKKIKDLNKEEIENICNKHLHCKCCPLEIDKNFCYRYVERRNENKEIAVEEDE